MFVIAGATGHVGSVAAKSLLAQGAEVRALVRTESAALDWESRGASAHRVNLDDRAGLRTALEGSAGFFVLLPFDLTTADHDVYADTLITSIAGAVAEAEVPHVIMLSSGGADLAAGTGPITGLHRSSPVRASAARHRHHTHRPAPGSFPGEGLRCVRGGRIRRHLPRVRLLCRHPAADDRDA